MQRLILPLIFFLLLTTGLSLADGGKPTGLRVEPAGLRLEKVEFVYRADADARFIALKSDWQSRHRGEITPQVSAELAQRADTASSVDKPLTQWLHTGGPSPNIVRIRVHLYNNSSDARLNVRLHTRVRARVGKLLVNPRTLITDFEHLRKNTRWMTLHQDARTLPVLAPGEDVLETVYAFNLPAFLNEHPGQWPVEIEVSTGLEGAGAHKTAKLPLTPDAFTLSKPY